jgi:hypothetical protein
MISKSQASSRRCGAELCEQRAGEGPGERVVPDHALGAGCAKWAIDSARAFAEDWMRRLNLGPVNGSVDDHQPSPIDMRDRAAVRRRLSAPLLKGADAYYSDSNSCSSWRARRLAHFLSSRSPWLRSSATPTPPGAIAAAVEFLSVTDAAEICLQPNCNEMCWAPARAVALRLARGQIRYIRSKISADYC